jgi:hypothetical protein
MPGHAATARIAATRNAGRRTNGIATSRSRKSILGLFVQGKAEGLCVDLVAGRADRQVLVHSGGFGAGETSLGVCREESWIRVIARTRHVFGPSCHGSPSPWAAVPCS